MAIQDFKISFTLTVNAEGISNPTQGQVGPCSTVFMFDNAVSILDNAGGASTVAAATIVGLDNVGGSSTLFALITRLQNAGGSANINPVGLVNPTINLMSGPLQNRLRGLLLNRSSFKFREDC